LNNEKIMLVVKSMNKPLDIEGRKNFESCT